MPQASSHRRSWFLLAGLFLVNFLLRLPQAQRDLLPHIFFDETIFPFQAYDLFNRHSWRPTGYLSGALNVYLPLSVANLLRFLFGYAPDPQQFLLLNRYLLPVGLSSLAVPIVYSTAKRLFQSHRIALWGAILMTLSPMALGFSRIAYPDHYMVLFSALTLYCAVRVFELPFEPPRSARRWYLLSGAAIGLSISIKFYSVFYVFVLFGAHLLRLKKAEKLEWRAALFVPELWLAGLLALVSFLATNPFLLAYHDRQIFIRDFMYNVSHYKDRHTGLESAQSGILFYSQVVFLTSFGIAGALLFALGAYAEALKDRYGALFIAFFPFMMILALGRYNIVFNRNMAPTMPYVFMLQGAGLAWLLSRLKERNTLLQLACVGLFFAEPVAKSALSIHDDLKRDSRDVARAWIREHVPTSATIGHTWSHWGEPIPEGYPNKVHFETRAPDGKCLDYVVLDGWHYDRFGPGANMLTDPLYGEISFRNPGQYPYTELRAELDGFLSGFELQAEFGQPKFHGPPQRIYKSRKGCH